MSAMNTKPPYSIVCGCDQGTCVTAGSTSSTVWAKTNTRRSRLQAVGGRSQPRGWSSTTSVARTLPALLAVFVVIGIQKGHAATVRHVNGVADADVRDGVADDADLAACVVDEPEAEAAHRGEA